MALDERKGVWKSGRGKGRRTPKGRQLEDQAWEDVRASCEKGRLQPCVLVYQKTHPREV